MPSHSAGGGKGGGAACATAAGSPAAASATGRAIEGVFDEAVVEALAVGMDILSSKRMQCGEIGWFSPLQLLFDD